MNDTKSSTSGGWTSTQAYVLSVICLLVGVAVGYLARGSASSPPAPTPSPTNTQTAPPGAGMSPMAETQQPTPEQLRQMADVQAQPLLAELKNQPDNADLLYKIGNIYYDTQQYPEAVKYYERGLEINPSATDVRTDLGTAYHFMGQPDRALEEYQEVLKIDNKHANALFNTGMVKWQDKGDAKGAIAAWNRLLETNPNYPQADRVRGLMAQAQEHLNMPGSRTDKPAGVTK